MLITPLNAFGPKSDELAPTIISTPLVSSSVVPKKFPKEKFIKAPLPEHFINFMKENKLDIDFEKIEKGFEKEFKYE